MNARRQKVRHPAVKFIAQFFGTGRGWILSCILIALVVGAAIYAWRQFGEQFIADERYALTPDRIEVTPQPAWIKGNVKNDVIQQADLANMSVMDKKITVKIARAFELHNWVREVVRVSKHIPAKVVVEVDYRRPVAMVEVTNEGKPGLYPVDIDGVFLPTGDFLPSEDGEQEPARDYLRIAVKGSLPAGPVGTEWGDPRIEGAARIAAILSPKPWKDMGLYKIVAQKSDGRIPGNSKAAVDKTGDLGANSDSRSTFVIVTREGSRVVWGVSPDVNDELETRAALEKAAKLVSFYEVNGPLDKDGRTQEIDLQVTKTAAKPSTIR